MEYVLKTKDLKKTYGNYNALNGLSMNVPKGSIYGLIGRNGVGKTTLIRLICGLQKATEGDFSLKIDVPEMNRADDACVEVRVSCSSHLVTDGDSRDLSWLFEKISLK